MRAVAGAIVALAGAVLAVGGAIGATLAKTPQREVNLDYCTAAGILVGIAGLVLCGLSIFKPDVLPPEGEPPPPGQRPTAT